MKIKVRTDDGTIEVEPDALEVEGGQIVEDGESPEGYVSKEFMQSEIKRRLKGKVSRDDVIETLQSDDDFFREAAEARGIELDEEGNPVSAGEDVDIESLKQRWTRENVDPLKDELEQERTEKKTLKDNSLSSALQSAAANVGAKGPLRQNARQMFGSRFGWDPETQTWALKGEDGSFEYSAKANEGSRYVTPEEFFQTLRKDENYKEFFSDNRAGSTGLSGTNGKGGKRTYSREEIKTMSDEEFLEHKADIQAAMKDGRIRD